MEGGEEDEVAVVVENHVSLPLIPLSLCLSLFLNVFFCSFFGHNKLLRPPTCQYVSVLFYTLESQSRCLEFEFLLMSAEFQLHQ